MIEHVNKTIQSLITMFKVEELESIKVKLIFNNEPSKHKLNTSTHDMTSAELGNI